MGIASPTAHQRRQGMSHLGHDVSDLDVGLAKGTGDAEPLVLLILAIDDG